MKPWLFSLKAVFSKAQLDREFDDELQEHLDLLTEEYEAKGMPQSEARRAALLKLGHPEVLRETNRDNRGLPMIEMLAQDLSFAVRTLWKSRGFTAIAVLSLALGIGANTALFSLVDRLLLRSLPVKDPDSLVYVQRVVVASDFKGFSKPTGFDRATFEAMRIPGIFSDVIGANALNRPVIVIDGAMEPNRSGLLVTDNFFSGLGVELALGRVERNAAVISDRFWRSRFKASPDVLSQLLEVNGQAYRVAGVAPHSFKGLSLDTPGDVWLVSPTVPDSVFTAIGRLLPGIQIGQAQAATDAVFQQLDQSPESRLPGRRMGIAIRSDVKPAGKGSWTSNLRDDYQRPLLALMVLVTLVLLITCTNIGNLLVVRNTSRVRELTVRTALGARRSRLIAQLLVESAVLAFIGGTLAWLVARWGVSAVLSMLPLTETPELLVFRMDARILGFLASVSVLSAVLFALAPAWRATRIDLATGLKAGLQGGSGTATARESRWLGRWLVAGQIALSVMLLAGAGLFVRTLRNLGKTDLGFDSQNLLQVEIDTSYAGYRQGQVNTVYRLLLDRLAAIPGVQSATGSRNPLLSPYPAQPPYMVEDVGPRFFEILHIPVLQGRAFTSADENRTDSIAVVSESYAKQTFPSESAVGKRIQAGRITREIVGVVADTKLMSPRWDVPMLYYPGLQGDTDRVNSVEVRTSGDPTAIARAVQDEVRRINPRLLISLRTMQDVIDRSMAQERLVAATSGFFGVLGVILAGIGLFGVASFTVAQRTSELGIRIAIGAGRWDVIRESLRDTALVFGIGLVAGGAAAFAGTRLAANLIAGLLYGLSATDWRNIAFAALLMVGVGITACLIPALRAARVNPLKAIRYE